MPPLIQILRKPPQPSPAVAGRLREHASARDRSTDERCEFCGTAIDQAHGHVVDLPRRSLLCVCRPCYLLFTHDGAGGRRFRAVPEHYRVVPELSADAEVLERLQIPIGLAFFFRNSATDRVAAFYPSPAGAIESELPLDAWSDVVGAAPSLASLAADVEALLVRRTVDRVDALIAPIDACYGLVGIIRLAWRGVQGGDDVWPRVDEFFTRAAARARREGAA